MGRGHSLGSDLENRVAELAAGISLEDVAAPCPGRLNSRLWLPKGSSGLKLLLQAAQQLKWR